MGTKLRQEATIKLEPISETSSISGISKASDSKENDCNSINIKREKISIGVRSQHNSSDDYDSSILVIPNQVNIITLSDEDDDADNNRMPPPTKPPPKKLQVRTKTRTKNVNTSESTTNDTNISQSSEASLTQVEPKKPRKGKKSKKPVLPMVEIKKEKAADDCEDAKFGNQKTVAEKSGEKTFRDTSISKNATMESVYEDASDKISSVSEFQRCHCWIKLPFFLYFLARERPSSLHNVCFDEKCGSRQWNQRADSCSEQC